ncbi:MAG: glutaredoxin family protein [Synechococcus sp.]
MASGHFVLYSKTGCHLCEGLEEKLRQISEIEPGLEVRDIETDEAWWGRYSLEIPVLCWSEEGREVELPRLSPRATVAHIRARVCGYVKGS